MKLNKMPKEELELLSYTKIAEMYLEETKKPIKTADLFKEICSLLDLDSKEYEAKIADFFQSLVTSKEFFLLEDGNWDLRSNHVVKININDIYEDDDIEIEPEERDEEEMEEPTEIEEFDNSIDDDYSDDELGDLSVVSEDELEE